MVLSISKKYVLFFVLAFVLFAPVPLYAMKVDKEPVDFVADRLAHDEEKQTVTATGNVELTQAGRVLRAEKVVYNIATDTVLAEGNVALMEPNGDVHFADKVQFNDEMRSGFIEGLRTMLADGSRFTAEKGRRVDAIRTEMEQATYTPCKACEKNPDKEPAWQINAKRVVYHENEHRISYDDAWFELFGVPVAYTPYFSHPDGTIKRKSGFLPPSVSLDSELGLGITERYYWDIAPSLDATIGVQAFTQELPMGLLGGRKRFNDASLEFDSSFIYSDRVDSVAGQDRTVDEEFRGHIFGEGLWDINDKWRAGLDLALTTDDQYLRQYNISSEDVLENELYVERFSGRDYFVGRLLSFQDVRVSEQTDQPDVLPEMYASFIGRPDSFLTGRLNLDLSLLGLRRESSGQDVNRASAELGWKKRYVTGFGLVNDVALSSRLDVYNTRDRDSAPAGSGRSSEDTEVRLYPVAYWTSRYPFARDYERFQAVIEPVGAVMVSSDIDNDTDIENEDSQDVQIDASNILTSNRFPGFDRVEDVGHATYGIRTGLYGHDAGHAEVFLGQSYRFDDNDNPFPEGSGLDDDNSDYVGQISASYDDKYHMNYRFQLSGADFSSERHELDSYAKIFRLGLSARYLYATALEGTDIDESREQLDGRASYDLTDDWRVRSRVLYDLGYNPGLRKASAGFDYVGECLNFSLTAQRELTDDESGDSGTELLFRIGLKNLGDFQASGLTVDTSDSD